MAYKNSHSRSRVTVYVDMKPQYNIFFDSYDPFFFLTFDSILETD